jgi:hypothetical protein
LSGNASLGSFWQENNVRHKTPKIAVRNFFIEKAISLQDKIKL